ncbi:phosphate-starvation-inducible PsiE family protein [Acidithiobacillus sp. MC6.1]|nr:phosphate-starvation-inducible PsiE family protein [Acidithiobacillus sp. MC6.1]
MVPQEMVVGARGRTLVFYGRLLDLIVIALIFVMLLTLLGALVGLIYDFAVAVSTLRTAAAVQGLTHVHGLVESLGQGLVVDVLSTFVLIELFRTFTDYLEFHRLRLRVLAEVGIVFVLREMFIGLYAHRMDSPVLLAIAALLAVLVAARVAAVQFPPRHNGV